MRLHCMYSIQVIILLLQTLCMHGGEVVDDSPMLARQGVTQQATHGRSLPSLAALEEGNSRPQGQLGGGGGGGGGGEEGWDMGGRKEVNIQTEHIQYEHSLIPLSIFPLNPPPPPSSFPHLPPSSPLPPSSSLLLLSKNHTWFSWQTPHSGWG